MVVSYGETYIKIQKLLNDGGKGDPKAISYIKTKLMLKGVYPDKFGPDTLDSPQVITILDKFIDNLLGKQEIIKD